MTFFYENQFGFRKNSSTEHAAMFLVNKVTTALNDKKCAGAVFLDMSKAFDCVDHSILLNKLDHFGIRGVALKWFESYFRDRKQITTFSDVISTNINEIKCGAPQGSILAPLLYLIYVNDLSKCTKKTTSILFADDTTLVSFGKNENEVVDSLNSDLCEIQEWLISNRLTLNAKKTKFLIFGRKKSKNNQKFHVQINDEQVKQIPSATFLGLTINERLSWKEHMMNYYQKYRGIWDSYTK